MLTELWKKDHIDFFIDTNKNNHEWDHTTGEMVPATKWWAEGVNNDEFLSGPAGESWRWLRELYILAYDFLRENDA